MRLIITIVFLIISSGINAQNDEIMNERYAVINALLSNVNVEKIGRVELDQNFFQFLGLGALISDANFIDNLPGHCADYENEETYSFSEIMDEDEIKKMRNQLNWFGYYKKVDRSMVSSKIKVIDDKKNITLALTQPLVYNNKSIVYLTNKNNEETLFVLVKKDGEWVIRCRKDLYLRFDD